MLRTLPRAGPDVEVQPGFACDPAVAYWALRFYAENVDARDELADGRALDRVTNGDLTP